MNFHSQQVRRFVSKDKISRKEHEYLKHRAEILQAALKLFSKKGFHNVSMKGISDESEFAVGTLYKFFSNKEEIYKALLLEKAEEFHLKAMEAMKEGDEITRIKAYINAKINTFANSVDYIRLYMSELQTSGFSVKESLVGTIKKWHRETLQTLAFVFEMGIKRGLFKKFDPYLLAIALDSITNAFLFEAFAYPGRHQFDADLIVDIFFQQIHIGKISEKKD
jgi:AcrR family transcriptional regulator